MVCSLQENRAAKEHFKALSLSLSLSLSYYSSDYYIVQVSDKGTFKGEKIFENIEKYLYSPILS